MLLGRGAPIIKFVGNVRFRKLVQEKSTEYMETHRREHKDAVAREIVGIIESRQGRFLRPMPKSEAVASGVPEGVKAWVPADEAGVLQKIKQAIRDNEHKHNDDDLDDGLASPSRALQGEERAIRAESLHEAASLPNRPSIFAAASAASRASVQQQLLSPSLLEQLNSVQRQQQMASLLNERVDNAALLRALAAERQNANALKQQLLLQGARSNDSVTDLLRLRLLAQKEDPLGNSAASLGSASLLPTATDQYRTLSAAAAAAAAAPAVNDESAFLRKREQAMAELQIRALRKQQMESFRRAQQERQLQREISAALIRQQGIASAVDDEANMLPHLRDPSSSVASLHFATAQPAASQAPLDLAALGAERSMLYGDPSLSRALLGGDSARAAKTSPDVRTSPGTRKPKEDYYSPSLSAGYGESPSRWPQKNESPHHRHRVYSGEKKRSATTGVLTAPHFKKSKR